MVIRILVKALGTIEGESRISCVRSSNNSSISALLRRVAIAIISATCFGFSEHISHILLTSCSGSSDTAISKSRSRLLIKAKRPNCKGYKCNSTGLPSGPSILNVSYASVKTLNALSSKFILVGFNWACPRSHSEMRVTSSQAGF